MKDGLRQKIMPKFVTLRQEAYNYSTDDSHDNEKTKGKKSVS